MKLKRHIITFILITQSSVAYSQADMSFNLICKGTTNIGRYKENYRYYFIVDLTNRKYCKNKCLNIEKISKIENEYITFQESTKEESDSTIIQKEVVNRNTGSHFWSWDEKRYGLDTGVFSMTGFGFCEKSKFTGFPSSGRKF